MKARPLVWADGQAARWRKTGLADVVEVPIVLSFEYVDFEDYWSSYSTGPSRIAQRLQVLPTQARAEIERHVRAGYLAGLPDGPRSFAIIVRVVRGIVPANAIPGSIGLAPALPPFGREMTVWSSTDLTINASFLNDRNFNWIQCTPLVAGNHSAARTRLLFPVIPVCRILFPVRRKKFPLRRLTGIRPQAFGFIRGLWPSTKGETGKTAKFPVLWRKRHYGVRATVYQKSHINGGRGVD
jgi:hypothetical protein